MSIHLDAPPTIDAKRTPPLYTPPSDRSVGHSTLFTGCASCDSAALAQRSRLPTAAAVPNESTSTAQHNGSSNDDVMGDLSSFSTSTDSGKDDGSFKTVLSYLRKNDQWIHHMDTVDQLENITFLRVMYLGITTNEERRLVLKKLSDGLSRPLHSQTTSPADPTHSEISSSSIIGNQEQHNTPLAYGFRERKHHLLPLHFFSIDSMGDDGNDDDRTAVFEDNGVYIVEADFTTDNQHLQDPNLVLSYIYHHCQRQQQVSSSALHLILNPLSPLQRFRGSVYAGSKASTSGIDLCIYFYHDAQTRTNISKEMDLLWKIHALKIPILPILSMSNQILRPLYHNSTSFITQRPTEIRRNELAQLFSLWRIKMMDLSNLDMLGQPSFQRKGRSRLDLTLEDKLIEKRLGTLWANSSIVAPMPYHVLTLFQFLAIDKWAISKLINTIKSQKRWNSNSISITTKGHTEASYSSTSIVTDISSSLSTDDSMTLKPDKTRDYSAPFTRTPMGHTPSSLFPGLKHLIEGNTAYPSIHLRLLYALPILLLLVYGIWITLTRHSPSWHASLALVSYQPGQSLTLMLNVYDNHNQPRWAPASPLIETNIPAPSSGYLIAAPLPNKTRSLNGQYFYSIDLPPCILLKETDDIIVKVKPFVSLSATSRIHGNPLHLSRQLLCNSDLDSSSPRIAWRHFRQHTRFYLTNSIKILQMVFTEGQD